MEIILGDFLTKKAMYIFTIPSLFGYIKKKADLGRFRFPNIRYEKFRPGM